HDGQSTHPACEIEIHPAVDWHRYVERMPLWRYAVHIPGTSLRRRVMSKKPALLPRRRFLKNALSAAGAAVMAPTIIPSSALGLDGAVPPSERIVVGGIGIGNRGTYDLGCFLEQKDVQFVAVCDIKEARRTAVKKIA